MLTALLILGVIAVIVLITGCILVAVRLSETLTKQADVLDRAHKRWVESLDPLFDRLMAHNWEEYVTIRQLSAEEEGGFLTPEEMEEDRKAPDWGSLMPRPDADEEKLLAEDFDDDGEPRRRIEA
jgi:hypothetical protein